MMPLLYHWLGSDAAEVAREQETREQLERELPELDARDEEG